MEIIKKQSKGRPKKPYQASNGEYINGLRRRANDGRWVIVSTGEMFSEHDEKKAIARFLGKTQKPSDDPELDDWLKEQLNNAGDNWLDAFNRGFFWETSRGTQSAKERMMRWVGKQIRLNPKLWASGTEIEELGYLTDLKPPEELPTFDAIEKEWKTHYSKSKEQKLRVLNAWSDFKETTGIHALNQITPLVCRDFRDAIIVRKLKPKSQKNLFTCLRRLFTWLLKVRLIAPRGLKKIVEAMEILVADDAPVSLDPHPIEKIDFWKLHDAGDDDDKALLLLMLNGAFNLVEVIRLRWDEIDKKGCIVTRRQKSGRCIRVCVLWKETIDALAKVKRRGEYIFISREGTKLSTSGADKHFRAIRAKTDLPEGITSSHFRDGASTALAEAGVEGVLFSIALGHSSGIKDHYIKRNPRMVAPAMQAVYNAYFPKPPKDEPTRD